MSFEKSLAIYFIVWWICLFVVLPFGVRTRMRRAKRWRRATSTAHP